MLISLLIFKHCQCLEELENLWVYWFESTFYFWILLLCSALCFPCLVLHRNLILALDLEKPKRDLLKENGMEGKWEGMKNRNKWKVERENKGGDEKRVCEAYYPEQQNSNYCELSVYWEVIWEYYNWVLLFKNKAWYSKLHMKN